MGMKIILLIGKKKLR